MARHFIFILVLMASAGKCLPQDYIVRTAPFSSRISDEFSPVWYRNGIVFSSNMRDNSPVSFTGEESRLFRIFFVAGSDSTGWKSPALFSGELRSGLNDGPATFNLAGDTIYFSRNNYPDTRLRNSIDTTNRLGIYSAVLSNGLWTDISAFEYNDNRYTFFSPSLSPDGKRLFFASDMPGGLGGLDLYFCDRGNSLWRTPVNMGPAVNTSGNESFPFATGAGKLYFSSDGHGGNGKKDIFYTSEIDGKWISPVHLDSAINSPEDDFGIIIDPTLSFGYFSSHRFSGDDIFYFRAPPIVFEHCDTVAEKNYCFTLWDDHYSQIDTIPVTYTWDFGNGITRTGTEVKHCFPGPGNYFVLLTITDDLTGDTITWQARHDFEISDLSQAYIRSSAVGIKKEPVLFDATEINLNDFRVTDYLWDFGDGFRQGAAKMKKSFSDEGDYYVKLGLTGTPDHPGMNNKKCFVRKIRVYNSSREMEYESISSKAASGEETILLPGVFFMDDLPERRRNRITSVLGREIPVLLIDRKGLKPESVNALEKIRMALEQDPGLWLEIAVHGSGRTSDNGMPLADLWASMIEFQFRQNATNQLQLGCRSLGSEGPALKSSRFDEKADGYVEFIFMEKR